MKRCAQLVLSVLLGVSSVSSSAAQTGPAPISGDVPEAQGWRAEVVVDGLGDGNIRNQAQNFGAHFGKVLRLKDDGAPHPDNPFVNRPGAKPEIWTLGHRNIQGQDD